MKGRWTRIPGLSRWCLLTALAIAVCYGILHAAGCRELVTIVTGTVPGDVSRGTAVVFGLGYVLCYLGSWIVAPVLVVAAGAYWGASVALCRRSSAPEPSPSGR